MNERIRLLADEAAKFSAITALPTGESGDKLFVEKFAELIVSECAELCDKAAEENARHFITFTQTKEVGPGLVTKGSQAQAEKLAKQIREHFGVEL